MNAEPLDDAFARFIAHHGGGEAPALAARHLSRAVREGHLCLNLARPPADEPHWPSLPEWQAALAASPAVGKPVEEPRTPLILDPSGRLYLARYHRYEQRLAAALRQLAGAPGPAPAEGQEAAVETATRRALTLISGGPGTGKTTTVLTLLERLLAEGRLGRALLAAPTGKAAARLDEALRDGAARSKNEALRHTVATLPRATTLDRLLGSRPGTTALRHHAGNPLAVDLLIVDEASMVALPLMAKLFDALPARARVVLLGDRDQLASVAPGSVLADLCDAAALPTSPLHGSLVLLRTNYRFGNESAIYRACEAIRTGDAAAALAIAGEGSAELHGQPLPTGAAWERALREAVLAGYGPTLAERDPARALAAFAQYRILAAVREGPHGIHELNRQCAALLRGAGGLQHGGQPLLITANDPALGLFNGDTGLLLPDPAGGDARLWAWFPGVEPGAPPRRIAPARLPAHEPAFALTVHKSQGSEFRRILLILPGRESAVLTRELVYTGLTRARERVDLWYAPGPFAAGVARRAERESGLRDALA